MFQRGSGAGAILPMGASSSLASGGTDPNGYFRIRFTAGKGIFIAIPVSNSNPLLLRNSYEDTTFPGFSRDNFTDSVYDPSKPIFIGKTIDTVIIKITLLTDLAPTDTIGLRGNTITGRFDKEYIGKSGSAGSVIVLDTVVNMLFTDFNYFQRKFLNSLYGGKKYTTNAGYVAVRPAGQSLPLDFPEADEAKHEITIFFSR